MSVERLVTRTLVKTAAIRTVGEAVAGVAGVLEAGADAIRGVSKGLWMIEAHYGRQYEALTGTDLCVVVGEQAGSYADDPIEVEDGDESA